MNAELWIAGIATLSLAVGHALVGRQILPALRGVDLPPTFFGGRATSLGMLRFTWHIVTVMLVALSALMLLLAIPEIGDPIEMTLRWVAGFWLAATLTVLWVGRRALPTLLRLPMPYVFAGLCILLWIAAG